MQQQIVPPMLILRHQSTRPDYKNLDIELQTSTLTQINNKSC